MTPQAPSTTCSAPDRRRALPTDGAFPILGALPYLLRDRFAHLVDARNKLGDVYLLDLGVSRIIALTQEALRFYPPAYWIPRTAVDDDEIDGFHIPAWAEVGVMTYVIHRHPELWNEPTRFDPSRFAPERAGTRHSLAWIPFGAGQRICVGKDFALMEAQLILARVLSRYRIEPVPGRTAKVHVGTALRPGGGVWLRLRRRS